MYFIWTRQPENWSFHEIKKVWLLHSQNVWHMHWRHSIILTRWGSSRISFLLSTYYYSLYVSIHWLSLVQSYVCIAFDAYRSYCTRIYHTKELGQLGGPTKLLVKIVKICIRQYYNGTTRTYWNCLLLQSLSFLVLKAM